MVDNTLKASVLVLVGMLILIGALIFRSKDAKNVSHDETVTSSEPSAISDQEVGQETRQAIETMLAYDATPCLDLMQEQFPHLHPDCWVGTYFLKYVEADGVLTITTSKTFHRTGKWMYDKADEIKWAWKQCGGKQVQFVNMRGGLYLL